MYKEFDNCNLCPRNCRVNRNRGEVGFCRSSNELVIAKAYLHKWEEPCLSGKFGSGTIFFSNCNLRCCFCQNYYISSLGNGKILSIPEFVNICLDLQSKGASNINLVTPTHYVPLIVEGLKIAKNRGLKIPIVYNSSGYENVSTIKMLDGIVDIYLPDFKYYSDTFAKKYSGCNNYFSYADRAIDEMVRQKGRCIFDKDGNMISGVIIRHLLLPDMENDSKLLLNYLYGKYKNRVYFIIMNQYTPVGNCKYEELNKKVSSKIYDDIIDYAWDLGIRNAFTQEDGSQSEIFIPDFNSFR